MVKTPERDKATPEKNLGEKEKEKKPHERNNRHPARRKNERGG